MKEGNVNKDIKVIDGTRIYWKSYVKIYENEKHISPTKTFFCVAIMTNIFFIDVRVVTLEYL